LLLLGDERKKAEETSILDSRSEPTLVLSGYTTTLVTNDFTIRVQEFLEDFDILVVDVLYVIG
jgi:hypothetical protein